MVADGAALGAPQEEAADPGTLLTPAVQKRSGSCQAPPLAAPASADLLQGVKAEQTRGSEARTRVQSKTHKKPS